jgi:hypothetical protein
MFIYFIMRGAVMLEQLKKINEIENKNKDDEQIYELLAIFAAKMNLKIFWLCSRPIDGENYEELEIFYDAEKGGLIGGQGIAQEWMSWDYIREHSTQKYLKSWMYPKIEKRMVEMIEKRMKKITEESESKTRLESWLELMKNEVSK